ncbi:MAG: hypothetical protein ACKOD0_01590 [Actinomycetota bacterium]
MSPARRLIIPLVTLALLVAAGSAWGAQDIGTAASLWPITVEVTYPCTAAAKALGPRLVDPVEITPLLPCDARRGARAADPGQAAVDTGADRRSTLRISFTDMNGDERSVTVHGPDPGAQRARITYDGTRVIAPDDAGAAQEPTATMACRFGKWPGQDPTLARGAHCEVFESRWTRTWLVQWVEKKAEDFGGVPGANGVTLYVSTWTDFVATAGLPSWAHADAPVTVEAFDLPPLGSQRFTGFAQLPGYTRWSKYSPGGYQGYLQKRHYPVIFGSFTFSGYGVYGPGDRNGSPTTAFGRNVYIDTRNSDYGPGWRRVMGVLTQPPNGTFCYELSKKGGSKGKTGQSLVAYRLTAIGPGLTPVVQVTIPPPRFNFGAPDYDPRTMKWGTGFSDEQAKALRDQAAMIGPGYRTKPKGKGSTDCGATLRQLPEAFFAPPPA